MRIVQINANYGFTSTGLIMKDISDTIEAHGNESYPSYQRTGELLANGYRIGNPLDWKIHAFLCRLFGAQGYYSWAATRSFERYLKKIEPDIVHLHNLHSNYINIDMLLRFLAKEDIATVITMHDCWWFTGKCFHYADCGCSRFMTGCGKCPKMKAPPASMLFDRSRWSLRNKAKRLSAIPRLRIVGCSKWVCDEGKKGILKDFTIKNIYNDSRANKIPLVRDNTAVFLLEQVKKYNIKTCLEIGTAFGFSAAVMGILGGVEVTTLEKDALRNMKAVSYLKPYKNIHCELCDCFEF